MKLLSIVLCSALCVCASAILPQRCRDPTFACQDLSSARSCAAVTDCIHDVWSTMGAPQDTDEICDICKEMVKEARDQLLSNMTQEEIKEVFEGSCKLLPIKLVADACIKVVDEIIPELVEMLASRMDPNMVCTVSGLCNAVVSPLDSHIVKALKDALDRRSGDKCTECTQMLVDVQTFLKDTPKADVKTYITKACDNELPKYICNIVLGHYFDEIYSYMTSQTPAQMCGSVGICAKQCQANALVKDELVCEFCTHVLQHIKDEITSNTTEEEFKTALLNFCKQLGSYSDKCTSVVNDYYDMLFNYIQKLDTKGMCTLIGLCDNSQGCQKRPLVKLIPAEEPKPKIPMIRLFPATQIRDTKVQPIVRLVPAELVSKKRKDESNDIFRPIIQPEDKFNRPYPIFERDAQCALCRAFSFYLEKDLDGDLSKEKVRDTIPSVCGKWMVEYSQQCNSIVERHGEKMRLHIAKGTPFSDLCEGVRACPKESESTGASTAPTTPSSNDNPLCEFCKDAFAEVEKELSDPNFLNALKDSLDRMCSVLPKSFQDDCTSFLNQNLDALIDILQQELKPDNICPMIGLCPSSGHVAVSARVKDLECDICKDVVTSFRQKLQDPNSKVVVQTFLEEACLRLPGSFSQECKNFVDANIDTLIDMLIQELDPDTVCGILKICKATVARSRPVQSRGSQCEMCKQVIGVWEMMLKDNRTEAQIRTLLEKGCHLLPSSYAEKCSCFVDRYVETVVFLITQTLKPEIVCEMLNVCPASVEKKALPKVSDVECDLCKEVVGKVEDMVKDQKTEEAIKEALDKVCDYLPSSIAAKCESFVNQYSELIITLLMQELDPDLVCAELGLCKDSKKKVQNEIECDLCKEVIGKVEDMVKDKKTEDEIKSALDEVCRLLPSSMSAKCKAFVDKYTDLVITLVLAEADPSVACGLLGMCPTKGLECELCQDGLHYLQTELMDANAQEQVKNWLKGLCAYLPGQFSTNCQSFLDQYGASLLTLLAQELDPSTLCFELQACPNTTLVGTRQCSGSAHPLVKSKVDECSLCTTVVDYLDKLLEEDDVDKEITKLVEKVCNVMPASLRDTCASYLDAYGPYFLQMIGQLANSKEVCQDVDLCPRAPGHVHLIGGSKCTFGPSYWCRSAAHASACKATEYCQQMH